MIKSNSVREREIMPIVAHQKITPRKQTTLFKKNETREEKRISSLSPTLNFMVKAVRHAGASLVRDFQEVSQLQVSRKGPGDFVSNADLFTEKKLIEFIKKTRPNDAIISEECGEIPAQNNSPYTWVMDPIDGTTNFLHAVPYFSVSLALLRDMEVIASVIYNPVLNELYYAEKGQGAFVMRPTGTERLRVSSRTKLETAMFELNTSTFGRCPDLINSFIDKHSPVRISGSTTLNLASLAAGRVDAFIEYRVNLWDIAGGYLLVKEAGGVAVTWSGKNSLSDILDEGTLLITTPNLKDKIIKILPKVKKSCKKEKTSV